MTTVTVDLVSFFILILTGWAAFVVVVALLKEECKLWDYVPDGKRVRDRARILRYVHRHKIDEDLVLNLTEVESR